MPGVKGKSGRKSKSTAMKKLEGTLRKDRINENEPVFAKVEKDYQIPETVLKCDDAALEWMRVFDELQGSGVLQSVDITTLSSYCVQYGIWAKARRELDEEGLIVRATNSNGDEITRKNPLLSVINDASRLMISLASELGITPASRSKVSRAEKVKQEDPFAQFIKSSDLTAAH